MDHTSSPVLADIISSQKSFESSTPQIIDPIVLQQQSSCIRDWQIRKGNKYLNRKTKLKQASDLIKCDQLHGMDLSMFQFRRP